MALRLRAEVADGQSPPRRPQAAPSVPGTPGHDDNREDDSSPELPRRHARPKLVAQGVRDR
jgi:hypothetical protein